MYVCMYYAHNTRVRRRHVLSPVVTCIEMVGQRSAVHNGPRTLTGHVVHFCVLRYSCFTGALSILRPLTLVSEVKKFGA